MKQNADTSLPMYYNERSSNDLPVIVINDDRGIITNREIPFLHCHNSLEIVWCRHGNLIFRVEQQEIELHTDDICVIAQDRMHMSYIRQKAPAVCNYMFIDLRKLKKHFPSQAFPLDLLQYRQSGGVTVIKGSDIPVLFTHIADELNRKAAFYRDNIFSYAGILIIELIRNSVPPDVIDVFEQEKHFLIQDTLDYIKDNYMRKLTVLELAGICHISENYYRRLFFEMTGETPIAYLTRIRIENACDLLFRTTMPIQEISDRVGFRAISSLNRNFKQLTGISPREWRLLSRCHGEASSAPGLST